MDFQEISKRKLFLTLSALTALFWVGAWFTDGYGIKEEGMVLFIPPFLAIVFGILGVASKEEHSKQGTQTTASSQTTSTPQQTSKYQELITIKELLDSGVLTQEEYEEQKKQILNK